MKGLAADYPFITECGLPAIHLIFDLGFPRKLRNAAVYFLMAICTNEDTFVGFFLNFFP